jgi:predicted Zn-dependent peptidase
MQQRLYDVIGNQRPWVSSQEYLSYLNGLDPKAIQQAARTYLKKENQFEFIAGNVSP